MTDRESSSDTSGSDAESYESSSSEEVVLKPIFVSRKQRKSHEKQNGKPKASTNRSSQTEVPINKDTEDVDRKKEITLNKASHEVKIEKADGDEFDGIDDTDDIYPEREYQEWRIREKDRYARDREVMVQEEEMKDEIVRRGNLTEQELIEDFKKRQHEEDLLTSTKPKNYHKGAFFNDNEDINRLLKRTYEHVGDDDNDDDNAKDHSRPTKLKFN
ncbi:Splicing factor, Prp19-binding domain-containing protein [Debaryomyces fabryi]|uniref:Splicing factor, Prp19-binding domain-containing protein n=1 Tax=Debaryomyces fabryi TaxID=58627 RepID=A0A0V1PXT2_9ASCO|nr:Splicing factor, Prp19-binding domain-containing protein [Debaryomyces fabryi]KSA00962.1 Splicing factor, Prp19-binding domain-containing protein [Debaryomyces fabryi]CUM49784.1 unnamed protein product [Debaryomyces fabryi]